MEVSLGMVLVIWMVQEDSIHGNGNLSFVLDVNVKYNLILYFRLMIILGGVTVLWGILVLLFMADNPKAKILNLTPAQEKIVDLRMRDSAVVVTKKIDYGQIKECLMESRYYFYIISTIFTNLQTGTLQTFSSTIIANFGYSVKDIGTLNQ